MKISKELARGSTTMLILNLLQNKNMYGYQIIKELSEKSENVFELKEILDEDELYNLVYRELNKNSALNISTLKEGGKKLYVGKKQKKKTNQHI